MSAVTTTRLRSTLTVALAGALLLGVAPVAAGDDLAQQTPPPAPEGGVTPQLLHDSVRTFTAADHVRTFDPGEHVASLGDGVASVEGETTISLSTDLLFAENSWELPGSAPRRIAALVEDVPTGATVQVHGHTDTQQPTGHDFDNQELSERRAQAVAGVLEEERPDLRLEVAGFGDTRPAVTEDADDPATHAANRRVEIVHGG